MNNIIVLGAGMVGSAIVFDLHKEHKITVADINIHALERLNQKYGVNILKLDVSDGEALKKAIASFDLVIAAVPGFMGYKTLKAIIECGKNVVDISFFPENALELEELAKQNNVTAIVDCGVAPGMDNIILGYHNTHMQITDFVCMVGGLPKERKWPFQYKAPFSPVDVIEEYTRPARLVQHKQVLVKPALSEWELVNIDGMGTLEAFNSDGLRSLIYTMGHIPNMVEKTLRYPGHAHLIMALRDSGFFNQQTISIKGVEISPLEFSSKILFAEWKLKPEDEEYTVMRFSIKGTENGKEKTIVYNLFDQTDKINNISSMARTTGYTCTAAARLILNKLYTQTGIIAPELIGSKKDCFDFVMAQLSERNIIYKMESR